MIRRQVQRQRFSTKRKVEAVLRLLRGEELDTVSRELGVTAARLSKREANRRLAAGLPLELRRSRR
ncbi:MAG: hypothetical protein KatS3mg082_2925 [Nitrospiraceae bacterium]|nr:MAG: hypothetical protein KatS3mg081_2450 [Gemmatimonadales bacterium]GIW56521.1 MAG: hypothetical protein KatS3mg082_2925 [Nitrospiraceae bacterium]